jgi:Uma2 family endonuclease
MLLMSVSARYDETIVLPRVVRFPVELAPPERFDPERLETWPRLAGRMEYVHGRLLFMPSCGDSQQDTVTDVVITLGAWVRSHPDFVLGANEAGMRLAGATRAADAALWRQQEAGPRHGGLRRTPPVLALEVGGEDEPESALRDKARWHLAAGVRVVWLVLPVSREVIVVTAEGEARHATGERLSEAADLPDLAPLGRRSLLANRPVAGLNRTP